MALSFMSKQGLLIGAVTLFYCLSGIALEAPRVYHVLTLRENNESFSSKYLIEAGAIFVFVILSIIFSILLILGIYKKRPMLVLPWLIVGFLESMAYNCVAVYELTGAPHFYADDLVLLFVAISLEIVVLYPIINLFVEMRRENRLHLPTTTITNKNVVCTRTHI